MQFFAINNSDTLEFRQSLKSERLPGLRLRGVNGDRSAAVRITGNAKAVTEIVVDSLGGELLAPVKTRLLLQLGDQGFHARIVAQGIQVGFYGAGWIDIVSHLPYAGAVSG